MQQLREGYRGKGTGRRWLERRLSRVAEGYFVTAHCVYSPELASFIAGERMRVVCILRDPRDVAVSQMHHIKQRKRHSIHDAFVTLPSDHEGLLVSIRGGLLGLRRMHNLRILDFLRHRLPT